VGLDKADRFRAFMRIKLRTIIRTVVLVSTVVAVVLVLRQPVPVAQPQTAAAIAANAQSFDQKMEQFAQAVQAASPAAGNGFQKAASIAQQASVSSPLTSNPLSSSPLSSSPLTKAEVRLSSDEVGAALAQATGPGGLSPDSNIGSGAPVIKDQRVSFEGNLVHGQFLANVAGKDVWLTVSGQLGSKDGYATFEPTEFKVGEMNVPVSLVNPALQKKLAEQRDRLKLPDYVGDVTVQNGELVLRQK
jgi:hypothetical protein